MVSLGIDVSFSRGLDLVAIDETGRCLLARRKQPMTALAPIVTSLRPDVIAIDSPPAWGLSGRSREIERQLAGYGIHAFATPTAEKANAFHSWMQVGFDVFHEVAGLGFPLFVGEGPVAQTAMEVFPHASAVVLRGSLPPLKARKATWRREVLDGHGVQTEGLTTTDQLDAALAALTGIRALKGQATWVGIVGEAVLVLPVPQLPTARLVRDRSVAEAVSGIRSARERRSTELQPCGCGCGALVRRRYLPGHDARHKSQLRARAASGDQSAISTLIALGWR